MTIKVVQSSPEPPMETVNTKKTRPAPAKPVQNELAHNSMIIPSYPVPSGSSVYVSHMAAPAVGNIADTLMSENRIHNGLDQLKNCILTHLL